MKTPTKVIALNILPKKFTVGKSYVYGYIGDSSLKITITIIKRTKCFAHFMENGGTLKAKIYTNLDGTEFLYPDGKYSKCPVCQSIKTT